MSVMGIVLLGTGLLFAGAALGFLLGKRGKSAEHARFEAVQSEFDDYRREVSAHFGETASRFQSIGKQYKELYEHLAAGSQSLCDKQAMQEGIEFAPTILAGLEESVADGADPVVSTENLETATDAPVKSTGLAADEAPDAEDETTEEASQDALEVADDPATTTPQEGHPDNVVELVPRTENDTDSEPRMSGDDPDDAERTFK